METENFAQYKEYVQMRLDALTSIFAQAAVGDFSTDITIPDNDDKFTELYVGIQVMLDVIREQTREMQAFNQKLSDQIKAQTAVLHKQNRLLEITLRSIGDAIVVVDMNAAPVIMNPAAEKLLGPTLLFGNKEANAPYGVFHSDAVTRFHDDERPIMRAIRGEATDGVEMFIKSKSIPLGIYVAASGQPLWEETGKLFGGVVVYRDISIHKQLEAELRRYTQELEDKVTQRTAELEQYLLVLHKQEVQEKAVLESIGDGVIAIDQERNILFVNQAAEQMLGRKSEDMIGKPFLSEVHACNENGEPIYDHDRPFALAIAEGKVVSGKYHYVRSDGAYFPAAITVSPIVLGDKFIGMVNSFRDITREIEIDYAKNELVSLASHQLRTPPTGIKWYTGMLLAGDVGPVNDAQRSYLEEILFNNQRMIDVVNAMLDVSRIELGTLQIEPKPTDIPDLIEGLLKELTLQIELKGLVIEKKYALDAPLVLVDPILLRMILQNLLYNAVKYTPEKGTITITANMLGPQLSLSIADTGCGIPAKDQPKIFEKLFRAENARVIDASGTGLGLYVVKKIIDELGGRVHFESVENKGTTFFVDIPLEDAPLV